MEVTKLVIEKYGAYMFIFTIAIMVYALIYTYSEDFKPTSNNHYNNYSRQAQSWLDGRLDLPENIIYLEIAPYNDRWYVSFPPFPSVVMLPFVAMYGIETPDHRIALAFALLSLGFAYNIALIFLKDKRHAAFFSLFLVLGTNYLHISLWGAVWYIAQNMAFAFTLMSFYYAVTDNKNHSFLSLFFLCAAMGCRPFNTLYMPLVFYLLYQRENVKPFVFVKKLIIYAIPAIILGIFYMWLNYARFESIFEFGHNHLPEHTREGATGQFNPTRIPDNLKMMFLNTKIYNQVGGGFPFDGQTAFAFWLASPMLVSYIVYLFIRYITKKENDEDITIWLIPILICLHLFAFSFHATLGGRQFGSRYAADSLPAIFMGILFILRKIKVTNTSLILNTIPFAFGLLINFHGTIMFFSFYF